MTVLYSYVYITTSFTATVSSTATRGNELLCSAVKVHHVMQMDKRKLDHAIPDETLMQSQAGGDELDDMPGLTSE